MGRLCTILFRKTSSTQHPNYENSSQGKASIPVRQVLGQIDYIGHLQNPFQYGSSHEIIPEEIGKLGVKIVNGEGNKIIITPDDFKQFWWKVNKFTSLSMSGVHYGHYKAATQDETILEVLALQLTVIA